MATNDQDAWVRRVLGVAATTAAPADFDVAGLSERIVAITTDMKLYDAGSQLSDGVRAAVAAVKSRSADAENLIDALEAQLPQIAAAFRRAEAQKTVGKAAMGKAGVVAFAKMRLRWQDARSSFTDAVANVSEGLRALLETDEFQEDPRSFDDDTPGLIDALAARLPRLDEIAGAVDDALDSSDDTPQERVARIAAATRAIDSYEAKLAEFDELRDFESTAAGSFPSISLIEASLAELKGALSDALAAAPSPAETERTAA